MNNLQNLRQCPAGGFIRYRAQIRGVSSFSGFANRPKRDSWEVSLREAFDGTACIAGRSIRPDRELAAGAFGTVGRNSDLGNRLFVDAVIWKFRVGTPRFAGTRFGGWCNTHKRFSRWAVSGVWGIFSMRDDRRNDRESPPAYRGRA